jgi:glycosyltransferase involved in cell wall biosynthesis/putative flippase GtrA
LALRDILASHGSRFASFSVIGALVLVLGVVVQGLLVRFGGGPYGSYAGQAVFSIELSFALNRRFTWQDRNTGFWRSCWKYNAQKLLLTVPNLALYALLIRLGSGWLIANLATTAVFTAANYLTGDLWSFARRGARRLRRPSQLSPILPPPDSFQLRPPLPRGQRFYPRVSVVIPCKGNEATIRATVIALLTQDYPALVEVILVGDVDDSTWMALGGIRDPRLILLEQQQTPGRRDPNVKRDKGLRKASGDILALVDSDIVMDRDWLSKAIAMLLAQGGGLVAGGMRSIHDTFWGRFVDRNVLAAKTPRLPKPYYVTAENFGKRGYKPPVTANAVFTRELYDSCPLDVTWAYGYEDYEWFWRLARNRHKVLFSGELTAAHHHRRSFRRLAREYRQSAHGCARFIQAHEDSPLSRKRKRQAFWLPLAALAAIGLTAGAVAIGDTLVIIGILVAVAVASTGREIVRSRSLEAAVYGPATVALGSLFTASLASGLIQKTPTSATRFDTQSSLGGRRSPALWRVIATRVNWPLTAILTLQAGLSLSLVWSNTAFSDEADYLVQGRLEWGHWLHGYSVPQFHDSGAPQIYPAIGALAASVGGLAGARILSMCFMLLATALLFLTGKRLFGTHAAIAASVLWAVSEPTLRLSFATYDPLACLLVVLSAWLVVRTGAHGRCGELVAASALALGLAGVVAVSFAIMIPAVTVFALLVWRTSIGTRLAWWCTGWLFTCTVAVTAGLMTILHLWADAIGSTITRGGSGLGADAASVARSAWSWDGLIAALAGAGVLLAFSMEREWNRRLLVLVLCATGFLVPAYQAYIGTGWSLDKHMSACTWFMALAAGYGASRVRIPSLKSYAAITAAVTLLAFPAITGVWYAHSTFQLWPNVGKLVSAVRPLVGKTTGPVLTYTGGNTGATLEYYLLSAHDWERWQESGASASGLNSGAFSLVVFGFNGTLSSAQLPQDAAYGNSRSLTSEILQLAAGNAGEYAMVQQLEHNHRYRIVRTVPFTTGDPSASAGLFVVWERVNTLRPASAQRHHHPRKITH